MNRIGQQLSDLLIAAIEPPKMLMFPESHDLGFLNEREALAYVGGVTAQTLRKLPIYRAQDGTKLYHRQTLDSYKAWRSQQTTKTKR